ncbi:MAG TPA: leucyl/phenylalanyl-tRNA--protein transferase [Chthonomonadales bacterium]|nr:leucyl/phenylalanyl-tRNA--protein transferase [Chthonomonadales bacterium]
MGTTRTQPALTPELVVRAYCQGAFPMANSRTGRIYWFRPDPRAIIPLDALHVSRSLARRIRRGTFDLRCNTAFEAVVRGCADRPEGTWISEDFVTVYCDLHRCGLAHSVECWLDGRLVGGLYGVSLGGAFMAESMFHRAADASKVALWALVERLRASRFVLLDVQYLTPHLMTLGAVEVPHSTYDRMLRQALARPCQFHPAGDA